MRVYFRQFAPAVRMLVVLSVVLGVLYPLAVFALAQVPGLSDRARGSSLIGQSFTHRDGTPILRYFQSRPSAGEYDPTASGASNLGPESILDHGSDDLSLLTQVCQRSVAIAKAYGVDGSRPFCTVDGVGAVLAVFHAGPGYSGAVTRSVSVNQVCPARPFVTTYDGARVTCAAKGADYAQGQLVPIRGDAPAHPAVPPDAVTASGSGLDPDISPAYARLQERVVARARGVPVAAIAALVSRYTSGRDLGFLGEPRVNVVRLNATLDATYGASP